MQNYDFSELKELIEINSYTKNIDGVNENGKLYIEKLQKLNYEIEIFKRKEFGNHLLIS